MRKSNVRDRIFRLGNEALWVLGGQVGVAVGGLLGIKVLTHLLSPHEFGRLSLANTIVLLVGMVFFGPLGQGMMRYWSISLDRNALPEYTVVSKKYIRTLFYAVVLISLVFAIVIAFSPRRDWMPVLTLATISGAFTGWGTVRLSILMAARQRKNVALINAAAAFGKPLIASALILFFAHQADFAVLGYVIATLGSACFSEIFFRRIVDAGSTYPPDPSPSVKGRPDPQFSLGKEILAFSYPFCIWGIFGWIHQSCDRWALVTYQGADVVGAYSVIAQLAVYPLVFGSSILSTFFLPIAYERAGGLLSKDAVKAANKILFTMTGLYIVGAAILVLLFYIFHHQLVLMVSNQKYSEFSHLLPALTVSWSFYFLGQILCGFGLLSNKPGVYLLPILTSGILAAGAVFYLASGYGPLGVIWGLGITGFIYASWCLIIARRLIITEKI